MDRLDDFPAACSQWNLDFSYMSFCIKLPYLFIKIYSNPLFRSTSWYQQKLDKVNWTSLEAGEIAQNLSRNARILPVCLAEGRLDQVCFSSTFCLLEAYTW